MGSVISIFFFLNNQDDHQALFVQIPLTNTIWNRIMFCQIALNGDAQKDVG